MGTTTVAVLERNSVLSIAHVGDGRTYSRTSNCGR
jgi:serine/threonine protein phosphatase PrpC